MMFKQEKLWEEIENIKERISAIEIEVFGSSLQDYKPELRRLYYPHKSGIRKDFLELGTELQALLEHFNLSVVEIPKQVKCQINKKSTHEKNNSRNKLRD